MKLFLSSVALNDDQATALARLTGKPRPETAMGLVENAADPYPADQRAWVDAARQQIEGHGFYVETIDLRAYRDQPDELRAKLAALDIIWFGGGNTFYLRWLLRQTGADDLLRELVGNGLVYGGGSAGAIIAGPTLRHFETADNPNDAPEVIFDGLGLIPQVIVPHMDNPGYGPIVQAINNALLAEGFPTVPLTDRQALQVNGKQQLVI